MNTDVHPAPPILERAAVPAAALLLFVGHFAPWAAHKTAALTLSAHDLAVFTHYTPGAGIFLNQWFYLPIWSAALIGALLAGGITSRLNRLLVAVGCAIVASLGLPGYPQVLTAFRSPDYQLQFYLSLAVMALVFVAALARLGLKPRVRAVAFVLLPLLAVAPLAGYLAVKPFIEQLYGDTLGLGSGWWITLAAILIALLAQAVAYMKRPR